MENKINFGLKKKLTTIVIIGLACLITALTMKSCEGQRISKYEQNITAYQDSLRTYKLKDSSSVAAKRAFLVSQSELQSKLKQQGLRISELQKKLQSKVTMASNIKTEVFIPEIKPVMVHDTVYNTIEGKPTREAAFKFNDSYLSLDADVKVADSVNLTLSNIKVPVDITVGQTKDNQIFVTSKNPYLKVQSVESMIIPPKKKRWGFGINIGPGLYYSPFDKRFDLGIGAQFGISYNF
jgi:hypothetical protein